MNPEFLNTYFKIPNHTAADLPSEFVIVTAFNPEGRVCADGLNQSYDAKLAATIETNSLSSWRVVGGSRDFAHAEQGYAIETDLETGIKLGVQFRQVAIFRVKQGKLHLVVCATRQQTPMGAWNLRLVVVS